MAEKKYIDTTALAEFLSQLKGKYEANSASSYKVNHAAQAGKLASAQNFSIKGDVTASAVSFDGTGAVELDTSIASASATSKGLMSSSDFSKLSGIASGAQVNVLEGVQVNGDDLTIDTNKKVNVTITTGDSGVGTLKVNGKAVTVCGLGGAAGYGVANNCTTATAGSYVLDAAQGKALAERISALEGVGRFLSTWNMTTGLPGDDPTESPYAYKAGDYYIVNVVPAAGDKLKPEGTSYTKGVASTAKETGTVALGDFYFYTKTGWQLVHYDAREVTFSQIAGDARDNSSIAGYLNGKLSATATVNGKAFSSNAVTIDGGDILATGYAKASAKSAIAATDALNASLGKLEYKVDNILGSEVTLTGYTKASAESAIAATDKADVALGKLELKADNTKALLGTTSDTKADATAFGYIAKEADDRATAITSAINALDATVGSTTVASGKHVAVQVVEADGVLTSCTVTESDIASAALLGTTSDTKADATAFGYIAKEASDRAAAITSAIEALDATVSQSGSTSETGLTLSVVETDGKLTSVSGSITTAAKADIDAIFTPPTV